MGAARVVGLDDTFLSISASPTANRRPGGGPPLSRGAVAVGGWRGCRNADMDNCSA